MKFFSCLLLTIWFTFSYSKIYATNYTGSGTSLSMSSNIGCALSSYTFTQSTANANDAKIAVNGVSKLVTITFPTGTNCATATVSGSSFKGAAITSFISQTGNSISFNTPSGTQVGKGRSFVIVIANITNAGSISAITCNVSTGNDSGGTNTWNTGYSVTTTSCPTIPINDNCGGAVSLTPAASGSGTCTTTNGTTFGATASPQTSCTGIADDDVWYTFVANNTTHQVTTDGVAGFNAVVQVMSGSCAGALTSVQCINNSGDGGVETASLTGLTIGAAYYVRVYHSASGAGFNGANSFTICITSTAAVCTLGSGNIVAASLPYTSGAQTTCGAGDDITSTNSTVCGSSFYYDGEDKVIQFIPSSSGNISITLTSAGSWVGITLYLGCPTAGGTCVAYSQGSTGNQAIGCASVTAGQTYYLVIDSWPSPACNAFNVTISAPSGGTPAGTTCSNAVAMTLPYTATGQSTLCYGNDYTNASAGSCGTLYESGEDKVYSFTTTGSDCLNINLTNVSTSYIGYQVYSGCPGVVGTTCISNGGGATSGTLSGAFNVSAAGTYYVVVDTWASPSYVNYDIEVVSLGGSSSNDLPCNATALTLGSTAAGDNNCSGGTGEPSVPGAWTSGTVNSVWYKVTVPASGSVLVKTISGSLTNTQIAAYTGTCGTGLTYFSANTNIGSCGSSTNYASQLTLTGAVGTVYYLVVDGESNATGSFSIIAIDGSTSFPGIQGQDCSQPNPVCQAVMSVSNPGYSGNGTTCDINTGYCLASGERNVVWYRVPISGNGTLNFNIVPNDFDYSVESATDYDFAVWQTALSGGTLGTDFYNCSQIAAGTAATIVCNYSYLGVTGIGTTGNAPASLSTNVCPTCPGSYNPTTTYSGAFETTIDAISGDEYLIAISNFSNSTSGFRIEFSGTATINYAAATSTNEVYWTGGDAAGPTVWTDVDNWGGCTAPSCSRDAFVSNLSNEPVLVSGQTYNTKDLTIQPGASLTLQANSTLNICGNFYNYGTLNADPSSTIVFNGTGNNQIISGSFTGANRFGNLKIDKTSATYSVTINNDIEVGGTFTTNNATSVFNVNGKYFSLAGNFVNNNGNTTFSGVGSTGTLEFNGASLQTYNQGSSQLDLNNVIVNNTAAAGSGVTLSSNLFIKTATGTLTFSNGTITTGSYRVDVANTAAACVSNGTSTSYVDGNLRRYLLSSGAYEWPVGIASKGFQRATTAFSTNSIGYLDGRFDTWPVTAGYPPTQGGTDCSVTYNQAAMNNGYWTLTANSGTGNYNMTLYPTNETNIGVNWTVMKRSSLATTGWLLDGTCVTSTSSQITRNGLSGFSVFSVAQSTTALPVVLIQFSGEKVDEDNLLTWKTATEHNNDYFTLERSTDGFIFEAIATTAAAGNSTTEKLYSQFDIDPFRGVNYYRLKQTDINGSFSYSNTISLSRDYMESSVSELFPNPTSADVNFEFNAQKATEIEVQLLDNSGRLVNKYMYHAVAGKNILSLDLNNVSRGLYTVVFYSELLVKTEMRKLIKR